MFENIRSPRFMDASKTIIGFEIADPSGGHSQIGQFTVPKSDEAPNKYYDYIVSNFDLDAMAAELDINIARQQGDVKIRQMKEEGNKEAAHLAKLFNLKTEAFKLPWIDKAPNAVKMAVRRSPNECILNAIVSSELNKYMISESVDYASILDEVDDILYGEQ